MLIPLFVAVAAFPARSVAEPVADKFVPSAARITGNVTDPGAIPDSASVAVNETVTSLLFQPFSFGEGLSATITTGGVRSIENGALVTDAVAPDESVTVPVTVWPAPSDVTTRSAGQLTTDEPGEVHVKCAVTGVLFHPSRLAAGLSETVIDGPPPTVSVTTADNASMFRRKCAAIR
jgi:hypothetical protein